MDKRFKQDDYGAGRCGLHDTEETVYKVFCGQVTHAVKAYLEVSVNADATCRAQRVLNVLESVAVDLNKQVREAVSRN